MLKNKLINNELTLGSWLTLGSLSVTEIMAKASFDWLVVDLEHSTISIDVAGEMIRIIDLCGVNPLVRLTSNDVNQIKRVMDAGANGIVVPMINSAEEARKAVKATRYSPDGTRGVGLARAQGYGVNFNEYLEWQVNEPVVIVQIEHIEAVDKLEEILTEPGVDGFIIGPYDLSCSMGIPGKFENDRFIEVMDFILDSGKKLNCSAGLHIVEPDVKKLEKSIFDGFTFIAYSVDSRMLDVAAREGISKFNKLKK
ncbi:aldolase/citrate lyase family protein [Candidatus Pseudothioglobus singularis]|jgi:2-dehydro-3-deoxyglucarate aldolase|nr:aldolase/citrate lyase family protein [Candidatus Pseudothioglobus singularis]MDB4847793.1 aldolase/citrate lyase family protein [Candidatus Pseudothioglobus singularis]